SWQRDTRCRTPRSGPQRGRAGSDPDSRLKGARLMARRKTAPGDITGIRYSIRTDGGPWRAACPTDSTLARAKRGRQWRAQNRMGRPDGTTTKVSRSGLTPAGALASQELVLAVVRQGVHDTMTSLPIQCGLIVTGSYSI